MLLGATQRDRTDLPKCSNRNLDQRINERLQLALPFRGRLSFGIARLCQDHAPEVHAVNKLPVVNQPK